MTRPGSRTGEPVVICGARLVGPTAADSALLQGAEQSRSWIEHQARLSGAVKMEPSPSRELRDLIHAGRARTFVRELATHVHEAPDADEHFDRCGDGWTKVKWAA